MVWLDRTFFRLTGRAYNYIVRAALFKLNGFGRGKLTSAARQWVNRPNLDLSHFEAD
jgi:hypothetical protein